MRGAEPIPHAVVREVEVRLLPTTLEHGLVIRGLALEGQRLLPVVRVRTDRAVGYGEAPPLTSFTGQDAEATRRDVEAFAHRLCGRELDDALGIVRAAAGSLGSQARCALDVALHDAAARAMGVPLDRLLGTRRHDAVRISRAIGYHDVTVTMRLARDYHARGIRALKLKVGRGVEADAAAVRAVRDAVGPEVELALDANAAYESEDAVALVAAVRDVGLAYFEQPVARGDTAGLRAVRAAGVRVMADESAFDADDVDALAAADAADLVAIKLIKCGGLRPALEMARAAARNGLHVTVIDPLGSAVSLNAGLALAAVLGDGGYAHGLSAGLDVTAPYAPHRPLVEGRLVLGDAPGLGVAVRFPGAEATA